jgi:twinkle protein
MNHTAEFQRLGIDTKGKFSGFIKTVCPRCANQRKKTSDPSLSVNLDEGLYKCHHCQWKGTVVEQKYNRPEKLGDVLDDQVYEFFKARAISKSTVDHFKVTQSIEYLFDGKHHKCINFNYYDGDVVINIKYKTRDKMFKMVSGAKKIPYNLNSIKESGTIIICEGEEETMCWHEAGYPFAVSCPAGATAGNNNLEWLDNSYNYFEGKKIYLATDGDAPGKKLREDLSRRFEPSDVYIVEFTDYKDANDYLKAKGVDSLKFLFDNAKPLPIPEISTVDDFRSELMDIYNSGYPVGDKIDYPELDEHITWKRGQFVVVSGVPGCFDKNQLVHTKRGVIPISEVKVGDYALSYNEEKDANEWKYVLATPIHQSTPDRMFKITLKDGTVIKVTENHEFYTGTGYVKIKDFIVLLTNG